jgi:sporulation protein YlmC with PRC-barrel domain
MVYLSELIHKPVVDNLGNDIGTLEDLILSSWIEQARPAIVALLIRQNGGRIILKIENVIAIDPTTIVINEPESKASTYVIQRNDLRLAEKVLDHQVYSRIGAQIARVNDLEIRWENQHLAVSHVLLGTRGLLLRLGIPKTVGHVVRWFHQEYLKMVQIGKN